MSGRLLRDEVWQADDGQAIANDPRQGLTRRFGPGSRMLIGVRRARGGCERTSHRILDISNSPFQTSYGAAIDTLQQVGKVVESLYAKVSSGVTRSHALAHS